MSVEEYRQKIELYMMKAFIREEETTTIDRFLSGLCSYWFTCSPVDSSDKL